MKLVEQKNLTECSIACICMLLDQTTDEDYYKIRKVAMDKMGFDPESPICHENEPLRDNRNSIRFDTLLSFLGVEHQINCDKKCIQLPCITWVRGDNWEHAIVLYFDKEVKILDPATSLNGHTTPETGEISNLFVNSLHIPNLTNKIWNSETDEYSEVEGKQ